MSDKLKLHSPDFTQDNIAKLAELFPNCVTEIKDEGGRRKDEKKPDSSALSLHPSAFKEPSSLKYAIDFDQLRQELSTSVVEGPQERYQLNWPGKREALLTANAPIAKTLRPCREESVDFDSTQNLFIEGDNLDALKLLQETYLGKVKMIYIDPPYNTGNDFIYEDDFAENSETYFLRSNQKDEAGNRLVANNESNGRFHSDWLSMMYPRLKLAFNLLNDDGFILVSIDDAEYANIKKLMDEIYGENNYISTIVWDKNRKNDAKFFSVGHEYMLVFSKNKQFLIDNGIILREKKEGLDAAQEFYKTLKLEHGHNHEAIQKEWRAYFNSLPKDNPIKVLGRFSKIDNQGPYRDDGNISWPGGNGPKYEVIHPITKKPCKIPDGGWRYSTPKRFWEEVESGRVVFGDDETTLPRQSRNLFDSEGQVMTSVHFSYAQTATLNFIDLMGNRLFENPKSWHDIKRLVNYLTYSDSIVVDFFSGSATTAHSVIELNAEDGGKRKFIMVQIPELCDKKSEAYKAGYKTIAEVSKERIRRAGNKIKSENADKEGIAQLDIGFRVLKIDSSNMKDVYYTPDAVQQTHLFDQINNIRDDRTAEDLLFQVLLDWGVDLTLPISQETIAGKTVLFVDDNALAACFDVDINEPFVTELAARHPLRVVFRDAGFVSDSVKINIEQIFKLVSPSTEIKTI